MSGIEVSKTESGWLINKDGATYNVTDKNGNGKWDSNELAKSLSGNGNALNIDDLYEARYQILQAGDGATPEEMAKYADYKKRKEAREQQQPQNQQNQQVYQKNKKQGFWQKFATIGTSLMMPMSVIGGIMLGSGMGSWSVNGGCNDRAFRIFGGVTAGMFGLSSILPFIVGNKGGYQQQIPATNTGGIGNYFGQALEAQMKYDQLKWDNIDEAAKQAEEANKKRQAEAQQKQVATVVEKTIEEANKEDSVYNNNNKKYLDSLDTENLDGEKEYSEEEIKNIQKIRMAPTIPFNHIGNDTSDDTKLSPAFAKKLNNQLANYEKYDNENSDNKFKYFTKEQYKEVKDILAKADLTKGDVTKLKEIYKESLKNKE